jgi:hypothetical protein
VEIPFNLEDKDDESTKPPLTLPTVTSTAFIMPKTTRKEHSTSAKIKAIYMLEEKKSAGKNFGGYRGLQNTCLRPGSSC